MRDELLNLINDIDNVKSYLHTKAGDSAFPIRNVIYDVPEFSYWKQGVRFELQEIYDRTSDRFIWDLLVIIKQKFKGLSDEKWFYELAGGLITIGKNIDKYYTSSTLISNKTEEAKTMERKSPKLFISHSTSEKYYASKLIELFQYIGLSEHQIFCSSVTGYDIPLGEDIYEYLKEQFQNHELHVVFMLSDNYYASVACMNEMGAAWILQNKYTTILLPGFEFKEIKGAINPRKISLKLDNDLTDVKNKLGQLKDSLLNEFGLRDINNVRWEQKRDEFINAVLNNNIINKLSDKAIVLLKTVCSYTDAEIIKTITLSGVSIAVRNKEFIASQERREVAEWESALKELLKNGYVEQRDSKGQIFSVTTQGFDYVD